MRDGEVIEVLERLDIHFASGASSSRVNLPFSLLASPCVAKVENMSSKVQAWRTPVTLPSGA